MTTLVEWLREEAARRAAQDDTSVHGAAETIWAESLREIWDLARQAAAARGDADFAECDEIRLDKDDGVDLWFYGQVYRRCGDTWEFHLDLRELLDPACTERWAQEAQERLARVACELAEKEARIAQEAARRDERARAARYAQFQTLRAEFEGGGAPDA